MTNRSNYQLEPAKLLLRHKQAIQTEMNNSRQYEMPAIETKNHYSPLET